MKRLALFASLLLLPFFAVAQPTSLWTAGNAAVLPHKQFRAGIGLPLAYTPIPKFQLYSHIMPVWWYPNLGIKKYWFSFPQSKWMFTTKHAAAYPAPGLKWLAESGWQDILSHTDISGTIWDLHNEILMSKWLKPETSCDKKNYLLTWRLGARKSLGADTRTAAPVDYPSLFHRMQIYRGQWLFFTGLDLDARLTESLDYAVDVEFISNNLLENWAIQHKLLLVFNINEHFRFAAGYHLGYGSQQDEMRFSFLPLMDLLWYFKLPRGKQRNLFPKGVL